MSILVISDTHGYFNETKAALNEKGLIKNKSNKVLLNGDVLDSGPDADYSPYYGDGVIAIDSCCS